MRRARFESSSPDAAPGFATSVTAMIVMRRIVVFAGGVTLLSLCWATAGNAQDDYARSGFYIGASGSAAVPTFEGEIEDDLEDVIAVPLEVEADESLGINAHVGYRFHPYVSVEAELEWLDGFDVDVSGPGVGTFVKAEVEPIVITGNAKGYILTGRYQPFVKLGLGVMTADVEFRETAGLGLGSISDSFTDFALRFGGGLDFYANENIVVGMGIDYVLPTGDTEDIDYVSFGLGVQFRP